MTKHSTDRQADSATGVKTIACEPFTDQRPGTAGLRKKVAVFRQPHYLATFVQAIFDTLALPHGARLVVGGDGRYFNREAIQTIFRSAAANGVGEIIVGQHGLLSTPAVSHLIRLRKAHAGFILTASHNPGGPDGDFGLKFNTATGGQAPEQITERVYQATLGLRQYRLAELPDVELGRIGRIGLGSLTIEVVDATADYARLMQQLFDFDRMRDWLRRGHRVRFDAMHGATGPYARHILGELLDAGPGAVARGEVLPDFGGLHPDPNPVDAADLVAEAMAPGAPDLLAASDGDGDRNMILGPGFFLSPGDSIAMMLAHAHRIPGYRSGVVGAARSMPTSRALDVVAARAGIPCYETPTGWRFFCNLLEAGLIGLCGEESFGTSSAHIREKDGLWAVLFWLNVLAATDTQLPALARAHWRDYGRHHYQRQDFHVPEGARADAVMEQLRARLPGLAGSRPGGAAITLADDFHYRDPVDGSESAHQGIRLVFDDGSRIVYRLSGTGTSGATLRVYLERHVTDAGPIAADTNSLLEPLGRLAASLGDIAGHTGLTGPSARI